MRTYTQATTEFGGYNQPIEVALNTDHTEDLHVVRIGRMCDGLNIACNRDGLEALHAEIGRHLNSLPPVVPIEDLAPDAELVEVGA